MFFEKLLVFFGKFLFPLADRSFAKGEGSTEELFRNLMGSLNGDGVAYVLGDIEDLLDLCLEMGSAFWANKIFVFYGVDTGVLLPFEQFC